MEILRCRPLKGGGYQSWVNIKPLQLKSSEPAEPPTLSSKHRGDPDHSRDGNSELAHARCVLLGFEASRFLCKIGSGVRAESSVNGGFLPQSLQTALRSASALGVDML